MSNMAALSGSFKSSQIKITFTLINLIFLSHLVLTQSQANTEVSLLDRHRRAVVVLAPVVAPNVVPENVASTVTLYDLTNIAPNRNYVVINDSAGDPSLFQVANSKLTIAPNLPADRRKLFDYEKFKHFDVVINAINQTNNTDVLVVTIRLQLSDINDEPPTFTTKPVPFLATLPERPTPGTVVFTVTVEDPDTNPDISFTIDQVSLGDGSIIAGRFMINELTGGSANKKMYNFITVGNDPFQQGAEYTIRITAQDRNSVLQPSQTTDKIVVRIGLRAPQFFEQSYRGRIYENTIVNSWVLEENSSEKLGIQVKQFQPGNALTFQASQNDYFDLQVDGDIQRIVNKRNIDYEDTQSVSFTVTVVEAVTGLTSSVQVLVLILDENDNSPVFSASQYNVVVREDLPINSTVITVTAFDPDSGVNGEIVFSLLNTTYFDVLTSNDDTGTIVVKRKLDYDVPMSMHQFYVVATDKAVTSVISSRVQVTVTLMNVNDNPPTIVNTSSTIYLNEMSAIGSIVKVILASDIDGDAVKFYFEGRTEFSEIFRIRENNGQVLLNSVIPPDKDQYLLKVIAVDDDSCCIIKTQPRTSTATFTVNIVGINLNKPAFRTCSQYDKFASVKEKSPNGTFVIQVVATDSDRGENGVVYYEIQTPDPHSPQGVFQIDRLTGNIIVKGVLIRDPSGYLQVTVKARNPSLYPLLESRCSFRVNVIDINDHAPTFSESELTVQVSVSTPAPAIIYQMAATDADFGPNANITYSFGNINTAANSTFSINHYTGLIRLDRTLVSDVFSYVLIVIANDNGKDPGPLTGTATVTVVISLDIDKPPEWLPAQATVMSYNVSESESYGYVITTLSCRSNTDQEAVEFLVFDAGSLIVTNSKNFMAQPYIEGGVSKMNLTLRSPLDYETQKLYKVSIVCQSFGAVVLRSPVLTPTINVLDANDEIPQFVGLDPTTGRYIGSVSENQPSGTVILQITATDRDETPRFSQVIFALVGGDSLNFFTIINSGNNTAFLMTRQMFDRENISHYLLMVEASDGAPASPPNPANKNLPNIAPRYIDVYITDVNDNPPSFSQTLYSYAVKNNSPVNYLVATVKAYDPDEVDQTFGLEYRFIDGNVGNAFNIYFDTGNIEVATVLDYETGPREYTLTLMALDQNQLHTATTIIRIEITDENDNHPTHNLYIVRNVVTEEDTSITRQNPKYLVTVTDVNRADISYSLYSDSSQQSIVNQLFTVNEVTGQVYLIGILDRDVAPYYTTVTIEARDEGINPKSNFTDVRVYPMDVNDNAPVFDPNSLQGSVNEHAKNTFIMTLVATDKDEGDNALVAFRAASVQPNATLSAMFIVKANGDIYTASNVTLLDRELISQVLLTVEAYDNGTVPIVTTATATITVIDINDQSPYFDFPFYSVNVSEHHYLGEIGSISVNDLDSDPKNRQLLFTLQGNPIETKFFSLQSVGMKAVILLAQPIDYKTDPHVMNFTLTVTDSVPGHFSTATLQIIVEEDPPRK